MGIMWLGMRNQPRKQAPEKFCLKCGLLLQRKVFNGRLEDFSIFLRRKYCNRECSWTHSRSESVSLSGAYKRATQLKAGVCMECKSMSLLGVHHKDRNPLNNSSENLVTLCASCHTRLHWKEGKTPWKQRASCKVCGNQAKGHGLCLKHYQRWKKYGDPLLTKRSGRTGALLKQPQREIEPTSCDSSATELCQPQQNGPSEC